MSEKVTPTETLDPRIKEIIVQQLGTDVEDDVTLDSTFVDDLAADSLDAVELVMAFEEAFEIEIPDEDADKVRTVRDAQAYLHKRRGEGKS